MTTRASLRVAKQIATLLEGKGDTRHVPKEVLQEWLLTLAPPQKRKAPTKCSLTRKVNRATTTQLTDLWREIVRKRDGLRCRRCKTDARLQAHHIISSRFKRLKWDTTNGLLLCSGCHLWIHGRTGATNSEILTYLEQEIGARALLRLEHLKDMGGKPLDANLVKAHLEKEMRP